MTTVELAWVHPDYPLSVTEYIGAELGGWRIAGGWLESGAVMCEAPCSVPGDHGRCGAIRGHEHPHICCGYVQSGMAITAVSRRSSVTV